jgi:hypothetical protein
MKITLDELKRVIKEEVSRLMLENANDERGMEAYDEFLDEGGPIKIGVIQLRPSEVLKKMDPIAYNVGLHDYMSAGRYRE